MKKGFLIIGLVLLGFIFNSCEDFDDVEPKTCFYCEQYRTEMDNNEWVRKLVSMYSYCDITESEILGLMRQGTYMDNYNHYKYEMECVKIMDDTYINQ